MQTHVKVLGVLYLAVSAFFLVGALFLILAAGSAAGIVGAAAEPEDAAIAIPVIGIAGTALAMFLSVFAIPGLLPAMAYCSSNRGHGLSASSFPPSA